MNHELQSARALVRRTSCPPGQFASSLLESERRTFDPKALEPTISMRLVTPFLSALRAQSIQLIGPLAQLESYGADQRISLAEAMRWLDHPGLGIQALGFVSEGSMDVTECLASSARDWSEALQIISAYAPLLCDGLTFSLEKRQEHTLLELNSDQRLSREAAEFKLGLLALAARSWLGDLKPFTFWFSHDAPAQMHNHQRFFEGAQLQFNAACNGLLFPSELGAARLRRSDPNLHAVLRRYADEQLPLYAERNKLKPRVQKLVLELLPSGKGAIRHVAAKLGMSRRTVTRHLSREGVRYKDLLESARWRLACQHLALPNYDVKQIAKLLGYSETAAFSRAFRRWSGQSPLAYRRSHRPT